MLCCHHQNDFCIKISSNQSHFNVLLIMRGNVIRQCPYITTISAVKRGDVAELVTLQAMKITHFFSFTSSSILGMVQNLKNQTVTKIKQRKSSPFKDIVWLDSFCLLR